MSDVSLVTSGDRPVIRLERHLADSPATVWAAVTEREQLRRWFPCDVIVEGGTWREGAAITFVFPPAVIDMTLHGVVLVAEEPRVLAFTWGDETLRLELTPDGEGTVLVLFNELDGSHAARNAAGWEDCLDRLDDHAPPRPSWRDRFDEYRTRFSLDLGDQEGPPDGYRGE